MKIHYVSGSRADFGLMQRCLVAIHTSRDHDLGVVLTGQHMARGYGDTVAEIRATGLPVVLELPVQLSGSDGAEMAGAMATELAGLTAYWSRERPDLVLLLGDRGEMVAAALAAVHLGIHVAHIHGGERSGTVDESFRHVISKLAHIHFPATEDAAERLRRMGEEPAAITVIGAPGLVGLTEGVTANQNRIRRSFGLDDTGPLAMVVFHPVVQQADRASRQVETLIDTLDQDDWRMVVMRPNSDAGGQAIDTYLDGLVDGPTRAIRRHLDRDSYLEVLAGCDMLIGNSSSGIIESASFGIPCVNIGSRQNNRLRNANTVDCPDITATALRAAFTRARALRGPFTNRYGSGDTDRRLVTALGGLHLQHGLLQKLNTY